MNYAENAKHRYIEWLKQHNPAAYARLSAASRRGMAGEGDSTWYGQLFSTAKELGAGIFGTALEYKRAQQAQELMIQQEKMEAARAQQQAISTIQQRDYAAQMAELERMRLEGEQQQLDSLLMFGGVVLAALVGAKLLKVI